MATTSRSTRLLPLAGLAVLAACGGQSSPIGKPLGHPSSAATASAYIPLSMGSGPGYASFNTDPYGGFDGRYCDGTDGIVYTPNAGGYATDELDCATRIVLMVPGQPTQSQDLWLANLTLIQALGNVTLSTDTHTATSRHTVYTIANLGLTVDLTQTLTSTATLVQTYTFTSATNQTLILLDSQDADINWNAGSGANHGYPGTGAIPSVVSTDSSGTIPVTMSGLDPSTFDGYRTNGGYVDPYWGPYYSNGTYDPTGNTGWGLPALGNGATFGDQHTQLQWHVTFQAGVPLVHTATISMPGAICSGPTTLTCGTGACANTAPACVNGDQQPASSCVPTLGGVTAGSLANGARCCNGLQCASDSCAGGYCRAPACTDGVANGDETDVDCGGPRGGAFNESCPRCATGLHCNAGSDCLSGVCAGNVCQAPSCNDHVLNNGESDVDCGAVCSLKCNDGMKCNSTADCTPGDGCSASNPAVNPQKYCRQPNSCTNTKFDPSLGETDVDCGGPCKRCKSGLKCGADIDCQSSSCSTAHVCN